eukprot:349882-Prorocentrum_minimum.AAC.1
MGLPALRLRPDRRLCRLCCPAAGLVRRPLTHKVALNVRTIALIILTIPRHSAPRDEVGKDAPPALLVQEGGVLVEEGGVLVEEGGVLVEEGGVEGRAAAALRARGHRPLADG